MLNYCYDIILSETQVSFCFINENLIMVHEDNQRYTVIDALRNAGGVNKQGSVRGVRMTPNKVYVIIALIFFIICVCSFFLLPLPTMQWFSDYWEHAAAIKALSENMLHPLHPLYASHDPSRQFIPYNVLLAMAVKFFGISVISALAILATTVVALLLLGVKLLADELFGRPWAPLVLLLTLLCAWGSPWVWTGFYEVRAIFYNSYYPSAAVLSLTFILWWLSLKYLRMQVMLSGHVIAIVVLTAFMYISHQLAGLFAVGGVILFAMFEPEVHLRNRLFLVLAVIVGVLVTWFWPYFNPISLAGTAAIDGVQEDYPAFYQMIPVVLLIGPAFLAIPVICVLICRRKHLALVAGSVAIVSAYFLCGLIKHPVGHRLISYFMVYLHLMLAWGILEYFSRSRYSPRAGSTSRAIIGVFLAACVVAQVSFASLDFIRVGYERITQKSFGNFPNKPVIRDMREIMKFVSNDAVVFSTPDESYPLPAFFGKLVDHPRAGWMIPDQRARMADNKAFFAIDTTNEQRRLLAEKYHATFVVMNRDSVAPVVVVGIESLGQSISIGEGIRLVDIRESLKAPTVRSTP